MKVRGIWFVLGVICAGAVFYFMPCRMQVPVQAASVVNETPSVQGSMEDAVINVANTAGKAVVSISTETTAKSQGIRRFYFGQPGDSPFGGGDLERFFNDFFGDIPEREYKQVGLGSGVIIDQEGYILTNEHVVRGADKITVTLSDGREFKGEVKGQDMRSDLAVIKINASNLPVAALGDSDSLRIGQWVVAIGNPFGFALENPEPTVTAGVISALHRSLGRGLSRGARDYSDLIQTDAAINPGNSGGPLVNLRGEIIGINVAIFSTSGGYQGIGFAIPVNSAKRIISRLIEGKKILYGWLGVTIQDLTDEMASYFGLPDKNGVLVAGVLDSSPAKNSGIRERDVIKEVDGKAVNNSRDLVAVVAATEVGRKVKVKLIRDKKEVTVTVEIGERPEDLKEASAETPLAGSWRGLTVEDASSSAARRFDLKTGQGVVVVDVESESPADAAGLIPGDVIVEINKEAVANLSDYKKLTQEAGQKDCLVRTARGYFLVKGR